MDLDRIDWTVYRKEDTGKMLKKPHFYFCLIFGALFVLLLVSCATPSKTTSDEPVRSHEPHGRY